MLLASPLTVFWQRAALAKCVLLCTAAEVTTRYGILGDLELWQVVHWCGNLGEHTRTLTTFGLTRQKGRLKNQLMKVI